MSHALAWQTTSRSRGLVSIERVQNVLGSESKPSEVKKPSPKRNIAGTSVPFAFSSCVTSTVGAAFAGDTSGNTLPHSCAHMLPSRCAGIIPSFGTAASPYCWLSRVRV